MPNRYATNKEIFAIAPEFKGLSDAQVDPWRVLAQQMIGLARFGDCALDAHRLLTAHFLEAYVGEDGEGGTEGGSLTAEGHGPASRSYNAGTVTDGDLSTTGHGRAFTVFRRKTRGRGRAVVMNSSVRQLD